MQYEWIERLQEEMDHAGVDARLETQLVMALEKGLGEDQFMVNCDGLFHREYSKDMAFTEIKEDLRKRSVLQLHLNRSGIYDHLPEGLIFQPGEVNTKTYNAGDMALDHRLNVQKEQEARRFFLPFENDFFWQRLQLEAEETSLLKGLQSEVLNNFFIKFWGIPDAVPKKLLRPLILLLPYAHKIAGNLSLTAQCLEHLLEEKVQVNKIPAPATKAELHVAQCLGLNKLGVDMVCGAEFLEDFPLLEFHLGPLAYSRVTDYLEGGKFSAFLKTFYNFFVPAGIDITTHISVETMNMQLDPGNEPVLGYSSMLTQTT